MLGIESCENPGTLITRYIKSTGTLKSFTAWGEGAALDCFTSESAATFKYHLMLAKEYYLQYCGHQYPDGIELIYNKTSNGYAFMPVNSPTVKIAKP